MLTMDRQGYKVAKVKCRSVRVPQIGDIFASGHGQKIHIDMAYRQEDLLSIIKIIFLFWH